LDEVILPFLPLSNLLSIPLSGLLSDPLSDLLHLHLLPLPLNDHPS
jgi:hypothetical protein